MQVLRTDTAKREERARLTAIALAVVVAAAALWTLSPSHTPHRVPAASPAKASGQMLIPSDAGDKNDIDHAIARDSRNHTVKQSSEQPKAGAAVDAIYRFESVRAARQGARIMI
jgi:hypothetical protein